MVPKYSTSNSDHPNNPKPDTLFSLIVTQRNDTNE